MKHKNDPSYDLEKAKLLASKGRVILSFSSTRSGLFS